MTEIASTFYVFLNEEMISAQEKPTSAILVGLAEPRGADVRPDFNWDKKRPPADRVLPHRTKNEARWSFLQTGPRSHKGSKYEDLHFRAAPRRRD
jgi:hypothetical protein